MNEDKEGAAEDGLRVPHMKDYWESKFRGTGVPYPKDDYESNFRGTREVRVPLEKPRTGYPSTPKKPSKKENISGGNMVPSTTRRKSSLDSNLEISDLTGRKYTEDSLLSQGAEQGGPHVPYMKGYWESKLRGTREVRAPPSNKETVFDGNVVRSSTARKSSLESGLGISDLTGERYSERTLLSKPSKRETVSGGNAVSSSTRRKSTLDSGLEISDPTDKQYTRKTSQPQQYIIADKLSSFTGKQPSKKETFSGRNVVPSSTGQKSSSDSVLKSSDLTGCAEKTLPPQYRTRFDEMGRYGFAPSYALDEALYSPELRRVSQGGYIGPDERVRKKVEYETAWMRQTDRLPEFQQGTRRQDFIKFGTVRCPYDYDADIEPEPEPLIPPHLLHEYQVIPKQMFYNKPGTCRCIYDFDVGERLAYKALYPQPGNIALDHFEEYHVRQEQVNAERAKRMSAKPRSSTASAGKAGYTQGSRTSETREEQSRYTSEASSSRMAQSKRVKSGDSSTSANREGREHENHTKDTTERRIQGVNTVSSSGTQSGKTAGTFDTSKGRDIEGNMRGHLHHPNDYGMHHVSSHKEAKNEKGWNVSIESEQEYSEMHHNS